MTFEPKNNIEILKRIKNTITPDMIKQGNGIHIEKLDNEIIINASTEGDSGNINPANKLIDITPIFANYLDSNSEAFSTNLTINGSPKNIFISNNKNKIGTSIGTGSSPFEITLDFGQNVTFNTLQLYTTYGYPKEITIQTSTDNSNYITVEKIDNENLFVPLNSTNLLNLLFPMITTRYYKLIFNGTLNNANRYDITTLRFYRNEDFNINNYPIYNNKSGVPFYFKDETYSKEEIETMNATLTDVLYTTKNIVLEQGRYSSGSFITSLNTNTKQLNLDIEFDNPIKLNALSFDGTGYGGLNDFDILVSDNGIDYILLTSIVNANIYEKDITKYIGLPNTLEIKYLRLFLKTNVNGNRYEFKNLKLYIDNKRNLYTYVNSDKINFATKEEINNSDPSSTNTIEVSNNNSDTEDMKKALNSVQLNENINGTLAKRIKSLEDNSSANNTKIEASSINGNLLIADKEVTIYDDTEIRERISPLESLKFRSMIGEMLDYGCFTTNEYEIITGNLMTFNEKITGNININEDGTFIIPAGKIYSISITVRVKGNTTGTVATFVLYNLTENKTYGQALVVGSANTNSSYSYSSTINITVPVSYKDRVCAFKIADTTAKGVVLPQTTLTINEVGRTYLHDPVKSVNQKDGIEDTPVGHIMSFIGKTVPKHYLICDGTAYNISDYPVLAEFIKKEFGIVNYFGGDGITTFSVPIYDILYNSIVPQMTGYSQDGYVASASSEYSDRYSAWKVFDKCLNAEDSSGTSGYSGSWASINDVTTAWVQIKLPIAKKVQKFNLRSRNRIISEMTQLVNFELLGSNDGLIWDTLCSITNEPAWSVNEERSYNITNDNCYSYYRLNISKFSNTRYIDIEEFDLFECTKICCIKYEPTYYMEYHPIYGIENKTILYEGDFQIKENTQIILSDSVLNYDKIEIHFVIGAELFETIRVEDIVDDNDDTTSSTLCASNIWSTSYYGSVPYGFNTDKSLMIYNPTLVGWSNDLFKIKKVVGIKCSEKTLGSSSPEDEILTDEEIDMLINNAFVKDGK